MSEDHDNTFSRTLSQAIHFPPNPFHPLVWMLGEPEIAEGVFIGGLTVVNATGARLVIGKGCDIASFVSINCADSHKRCIGLADEIERGDIILGDHVFVGSHSVIKGGTTIGHNSVVAAGTVVPTGEIPPYSLVSGNPGTVRAGYYRNRPASQQNSDMGA